MAGLTLDEAMNSDAFLNELALQYGYFICRSLDIWGSCILSFSGGCECYDASTRNYAKLARKVLAVGVQIVPHYYEVLSATEAISNLSYRLACHDKTYYYTLLHMINNDIFISSTLLSWLKNGKTLHVSADALSECIDAMLSFDRLSKKSDIGVRSSSVDEERRKYKFVIVAKELQILLYKEISRLISEPGYSRPSLSHHPSETSMDRLASHLGGAEVVGLR